MNLKKALEKLAAMEEQLKADGPIQVPNWVVNPVDRELVRLGYARAVVVPSSWVGGENEQRVIDNATTPEEQQILNFKRERIAAVQRERKKRGGERREITDRAANYSVKLQKEGVKKGTARTIAANKFERSVNAVRNAEYRIAAKKEKSA